MVLTALAIPITIVAWMMWHGSPKEILAVADKFKPQEGWQLKHETIYPPANFCIGQRCPSVWRFWETSEYYDNTKVEEFLKQAYGSNVAIEFEHDCELGEVVSDKTPSKYCEANTIVDQYIVSVRQESKYNESSKGVDNTLALSLRDKDD